ncbi:MAG: Holliday junction resolvase RuvX [Chloroflexi bacterium]|nr:Holliday junction resolvase RuvX [Chloroflexota bacterium]
MRVLGLDVGERRIGLALSDEGGILATPRGAMERRSPSEDVVAILEIARREGVGRIIVGLPASLSGGLGPQAERTLAFRRLLEEGSPVPVESWDERLSTVEAGRRLREAGVSPSREKGRRDAAAAAVVLQAYLDATSERRGEQ